MFKKGIIDIELLGDHIIVSRNLKISLAEAEGQIAQLEYSGVGLPKYSKVEKAKLPAFALAFYYHLFSQRSIPTETDLFERYISFSGKLEGDKVLIEDEPYSVTGLRARLLRTYPSLIRDFHLYLLLKESQRFDRVSYSLRKDYYEGFDLVLSHQSVDYFLSVFIQTRRSAEFKKKKYQRHDYTNIKEIVVALPFKSMRRLGEIYVCTPAHIQTVLDQIEQEQ